MTDRPNAFVFVIITSNVTEARFIKIKGHFSILFASLLAFPSIAHAYLDPGIWSIVFQSMVAGAVVLVVFWRNLITRAKIFFCRLKKGGETNASSTDPDDIANSPAEKEDR